MASLNDRVFDNGLTVLDTEANRIDYCSQEPTTFTGATVTYSLGRSTSLSIAAPADRAGGGRAVTVAAITDGVGTAAGTGTHYAISDTVNSRLLATGAITPNQAIVVSGVITSPSFVIGIPDPA